MAGARFTAVSASIAPVLACGHETLLEGPEEQGGGGEAFERGEGDRLAARRLAAQKKSRIAQERDEGLRGLWWR